jgi:hypothetical protein
MVGETASHVGVERTSCALADEVHRALRAAQQTLEGGVSRDVDDPHRQRDLLTLRAPKGPPAVPALREVGQQSRHRRGKAHPAGQHPRHLAGRGDFRTLLSGQPREPARDLQRAHRPRPIGLRQRPQKPEEDLAPRPPVRLLLTRGCGRVHGSNATRSPWTTSRRVRPGGSDARSGRRAGMRGRARETLAASEMRASAGARSFPADRWNCTSGTIALSMQLDRRGRL